MKKLKIIRISILPLVLFIGFVAVTEPQANKKEQGKSQQKEKQGEGTAQADRQRNQKNQQKGNPGNEDKKADNPKNNEQERKSQGDGNLGKNSKNDKNEVDQIPNNASNGKNKPKNSEKGRLNSPGNHKVMNGNRDVELDWGISDFAQRKRPDKLKKISICHHTSDNSADYPVTISVSENAVQAHLNHGDQLGACSTNYSDRWSQDYIQSREQVYNKYEQTWETMSYSEALLKYAAERLLGLRTNLNSSRASLAPAEVQRREALILDLENNMNKVQLRLDNTRQVLDSNVSLIVQL